MKTLVITATLIFTAAPPPAFAIGGAWRADGAYVVRASSAEIADATGRAALLSRVERAAAEICIEEETRGARSRCIDEAIELAMEAGSTPGARDALGLARDEGGGRAQTARAD
jgi:UrcA family protein